MTETPDMTAPPDITEPPVIRIVAAVILNRQGHLLLVRKRDTVTFMQPGGKFEPGETGPQALCRELGEELGFVVDEADLEYVGRFAADAANEVGHRVDCDVHFTVIESEGVASAEIDELLWIDPRQLDEIALAPLTADVMRPYILTMSAAIQNRMQP
jgi:8-oxo-dGTP pyrophosphatase MutT (NUDIX family)